MNFIEHDFRQTWLWRQAFTNQRNDSTVEEREFFRSQYLLVRERAAQLVSRIAGDLPYLTVHDVTHLDALWETASLISEDCVNVNPAEAFVLGTSILFHDSAMSLAAYPNGLAEIESTLAWKDAMARHALLTSEGGGDAVDVRSPSEAVVLQVLPEVLRRLHAERAEVLAEQAWRAEDGSPQFLIEDSELRRFYGPTIGQIAHSHWWSLQRVEQEFSQELGALPGRTQSRVDRIKLACLLRVADALHLDSRRAPRFLRTVVKPKGVSALHWSFQEHLARPHIESDAVVFTVGQPFLRADAEAWWLAYDTLNSVDRELRDVDSLLQSRGHFTFKARRVKGAESPEALARSVTTKGWRPVDARLQVSDVPRIVENLGGSKLYGNDPTVVLRELIQNAADAIQARRRHENRPDDYGTISVSLDERDDEVWLVVEDNGIGMSELVLTGPLLDFGTSFWRSPLTLEEFPGLMAAGMRAIGQFGIGFFSVFMLGSNVRVYSRRSDTGKDMGRLLEFREGTSTRPILSPHHEKPMPIDGGTRIEVLLKIHPHVQGGLLYINSSNKQDLTLDSLVGALAPSIDVTIEVQKDATITSIFKPDDWLKLSPIDLIRRLDPTGSRFGFDLPKGTENLMTTLESETGQLFGRAYITGSHSYSFNSIGRVTVAGLRACSLSNVAGVLLGEATTAVRDIARPLVTREALSSWATNQAKLITQHIKDEERQARSAEVILECGGNIGDLKIVKWGTDWLSSSQFEDRLNSVKEVVVSFRGDFEYDEDVDDVHPKQFQNEFEVFEDIVVAFKHNGSIIVDGNSSWPKSLIGGLPQQSYSNVAIFLRKLIVRVFGDELEEDIDYCVVGMVGKEEITRRMEIFRRTEPTI